MTTNGKKPRKPGTFKKGDPRINRKGRPKSFDAIRAIAREIADETARRPNGDAIVIDGNEISVAEAILRKWATSNTARLQQAFIEVAFGKVPDVKHISGDGDDIEVVLKWAGYDDDAADDDDDDDEVDDENSD